MTKLARCPCGAADPRPLDNGAHSVIRMHYEEFKDEFRVQSKYYRDSDASWRYVEPPAWTEEMDYRLVGEDGVWFTSFSRRNYKP